MEIIDQIFTKIYTLLDRAVDFLKHLTRLEIMVKLNEMSRKIHSSLIVLSIIFLTLLFIILSVVSKSGLYITYAVLSILGILILSYLAKDFHVACEGLISANKTTLRSNAILRFSAILTLLIAVISFLASLVSFFTGDIDLSLLLLLYTLLLYINAGTLFNPSLINISISSDSTSGEDFITIFSSGLKSFVYFERIISSLLILSGIFQIIEIIIDYNFYFSDMYMAGGLIAAGIAFPLIAYLLFTILWFVNSLLLAILSLKRSN